MSVSNMYGDRSVGTLGSLTLAGNAEQLLKKHNTERGTELSLNQDGATYLVYGVE